MKSNDRVVWCDRGWMPTHYGFCPTEKAWKRKMKRLAADEPYPDTDGRCTAFDNKASSKTCVIVTISAAIDAKDDPIGVVGLLVHEAAHVWQVIRKDIGETSPSAEFEAYALQNITTNLIKAFAETRGVKGMQH